MELAFQKESDKNKTKKGWITLGQKLFKGIYKILHAIKN